MHTAQAVLLILFRIKFYNFIIFLDKLEELAPINKNTYLCEECSCIFNTLKQFHKHKNTHNPIRIIRKCSLCPHSGSKDVIIRHYTEDHHQEIVYEEIEFNSFEDFQVFFKLAYLLYALPYLLNFKIPIY